ncbi:hypothetical protein QFC19_008635 [Naganishia cerealis]|uniref:Uncharacterized protein n=1 Tax=Naganishia cerealis TaxID=610337 RepID=A0ACC2V043_9TREE|nr:hypothetical protein QFC19_008635 [Naganishia cerealis]
MDSQLPASPAPPSPPAPLEPGPSDFTAVLAASHAPELLEESSSASGIGSKEDRERAILIECTEVFVLVLESDWQGVAAVGLAMDLKVYMRRLQFPHSHDDNGSVAYALSKDSLSGVFPAVKHLEQVLHLTHDPRFDYEIKQVALTAVKHLQRRRQLTALLIGTHRSRVVDDVARAYATIPPDLLATYLGFTGDTQQELHNWKRSVVRIDVSALGWELDPSTAQYRPRMRQGKSPSSSSIE